MTDHTNVPVVVTGDWIDAAWINQYIKDNFAAMYQAYLAAGDMSYAIDADTIGRLTITPGGILIAGASAPNWLAVPGGLGFLKHNGSAPSWFTGGLGQNLLRKNAGNTDFEWVSLANMLNSEAIISGQSGDDLFVAAGPVTLKRLAKGDNLSVMRVSSVGSLEYAPLGAYCLAKRSSVMTGVSVDPTSVYWNASEGLSWWATTKITVPVAGDYEISGSVLVSTHTTRQSYQAEIRLNGVATLVTSAGWSESGIVFTGNLPGRICPLNAGDYIEVLVTNCAGNILAESYIQVKRVR